jgi:hypothetical protein
LLILIIAHLLLTAIAVDSFASMIPFESFVITAETSQSSVQCPNSTDDLFRNSMTDALMVSDPTCQNRLTDYSPTVEHPQTPNTVLGLLAQYEGPQEAMQKYSRAERNVCDGSITHWKSFSHSL